MYDPLKGLSTKLISYAKQSLSTVRELDTAMTELEAATSMTAGQLESFYDSANDIARQTGFTTQEIIRQAAACSRLGITSAEATAQMTKLSAQLQRLAPGITSEKAITGLLDIMTAYGIEANDVLDGILSKLNAVSRQFALNNADILAMLRTSASAMAEGNNTLDETIALEAAAFAITRDTGVTDALQTAALRLRDIREETKEADASLQNLKTTLYDMTGISVMSDPTDPSAYKSTYQILKEISTVWDSLSNAAQNSISELIFGESGSSFGTSLLADFSNVEKAMDTMAHSAGSAESSIAASMDSIDAKIKKIKETGTGIAQNLFDREDLKSVLDILNSFTSVLDVITKKLGALGTIPIITTIGGGILSSKGLGLTNYVTVMS